MGYEALAVIALGLFAQFVKKYVYPAAGSAGVHGLVFMVALVGVGVWQAAQSDPSIMIMLRDAGAYLLATVGLYEVIMKRIGFKSIRSELSK